MTGGGMDAGSCPRCQKCERWRAAPDHFREPMLLWDSFPCPPPGTDKTKLLLELDWTGRLGPTNGCLALRRVAKRCKLELTNLSLPDSLRYCDKFYSMFGICGTQCVIAIILACICLMFVFILVIVCCRYVRRTDKPAVSGACTKVVSGDEASLQSQMSRYYIQSQYCYRAGNLPDRRGLPFEVRSTENGVEARLIKAIQQTPGQAGYQFDDMCAQCKTAISRNSTLSSGRSRQGYERIHWRERETLERRAPSHDSLVHRRQSDRNRSIAGSSSDMSHYYEYISDTPYDIGTYSGRRSNHSTVYFPRNTSASFKDAPSHYNDSRCSEEDRALMLSRLISKEIVPFKGGPGYRDFYKDDKNPYGGSLKEECYCSDSGIVTDKDRRYTVQRERQNSKCSIVENFQGECIPRDQIKGYKYTFNPNFDEETTTTTSRNELGDVSSSPCTPSDCLDFAEPHTTRDKCDNSSSPSSIRLKVKGSRTPSLRSNRNSDSTSLSDNNASLTNLHTVPRTNGTFYKSNRPK